MQLRSELREKEMKLTDIRLEALSSAHQLDQLREAMNRMQVCARQPTHVHALRTQDDEGHVHRLERNENDKKYLSSEQMRRKKNRI